MNDEIINTRGHCMLGITPYISIVFNCNIINYYLFLISTIF